MIRAMVCVMVLTLWGTADAQPDKPAPKPRPAEAKQPSRKEQDIVVGGMTLGGTDRRVKLLIFLERANEELERASLERRSFLPQLANSIEADGL